MNHYAVLVSLLALGGCESLGDEAPSDPAGGPIATASADRFAVQRGAAYARTNCAGCHAVGTVGDSPLAEAPRFRDLGRRYPVADLAEAFAEGIVTAHPAMPQFEMSTGENADLIAYLESLQNPAA